MKKLTGMSAAELLKVLMREDVILGAPEEYEEYKKQDKGCRSIEGDDLPWPGFKCTGECGDPFKRCVLVITTDEFGEPIVFCNCVRPRHG